MWSTPEELKEYVITTNKSCQYKFIPIDERSQTVGVQNSANFDYRLIHEELQNFALKQDGQEVQVVDEFLQFHQYKYTVNLLSQWLKCPDGNFGCPPCRQIFTKKHLLVNHIRTTHYGTECKRTDFKKYVSKSKPKPEVPEAERTCPTCHLVLKTLSTLRGHQVSFHTEKQFKCEECGMEFSFKRQLDIHVNSQHTKLRSYPCPFCPKVVFSSASRKSHIIHKHQKTRPFTCEVCGKAFVQADKLRIHLRAHSERRDFGCSACSRKFKSKMGLRKHSETHRPEAERRTHECDFCHKLYLSKESLRAHFSCHTKERPYICHFCGDRFRLPTHLGQHVRKHTREKPYHCSKCDKTFALKHQRDNHEMTHQGIRRAKKEKIRENTESESD